MAAPITDCSFDAKTKSAVFCAGGLLSVYSGGHREQRRPIWESTFNPEPIDAVLAMSGVAVIVKRHRKDFELVAFALEEKELPSASKHPSPGAEKRAYFQEFKPEVHTWQAERAWVNWAANKSFEISKFNFNFPRARTVGKALAEI